MIQLVQEQDCIKCVQMRHQRFYGCCCCFKKQRLNSAPLLIAEEKRQILKEFPISKQYFKLVVPQGWQIKLIEGKDGFYCPFLNQKQWRCEIYPLRPLECKIFPAAFTKQNHQVWLGINKECAAIKQQKKRSRKSYLQSLRQETKEFLEIFIDYISLDPLVEPLIPYKSFNFSSHSIL